jgi:KDO2-lipid IV(A) lauroyltransferase
MRKLIFLLQALAIYVVTYPLSFLPFNLALKAGSLVGIVAFHLWKSRREIAIKNLSLSIKCSHIKTNRDVITLVKENFKNMGRSLIEVIKIYHGKGKKILDNVEIRGYEYYNNALKKGKGVILITGHCGNWEVLALTASYKINPVNVVARPINNPILNRLIENVRQEFGNRVIYKQGALKEILRELKAGRTVGILMDQSVLPNEGVIVEFLGRPAWTIKTPAIIARKTGAPVIPVFIRRNGERHIIEIHDEVKLSKNPEPEEAIREDIQKFTRFIENYVKQNPTEWLWIHRRWKRTQRSKEPVEKFTPSS